MSSTRIVESKQCQAAWQIMVKMDEFTNTDVEEKTGTFRDTVRRYIKTWTANGRIAVSDRRKGRIYYTPIEAQMRLLETTEVSLEPASPEGNMWRTMNGLPSFSPTDLAAHSNCGGINVSLNDAKTYARSLLKANYLRVVEKASGNAGEARYRLIEKTGPRPPKIRRIRAIFDPNDGLFVLLDGETR